MVVEAHSGKSVHYPIPDKDNNEDNLKWKKDNLFNFVSNLGDKKSYQ